MSGAVRSPTERDVLAHVTTEWQTTNAVFLAWLGDDADRVLSRYGRDKLRAEVYLHLDRLFLKDLIECQRPNPDRAEWKRP